MSDRKNKKNRPRRRNGVVEIVNAFLTILVIAILVTGGIFLYGIHYFYRDDPALAETTFQVERGNSLATVAGRLEEAGIVDNRWVFYAGAIALKKDRAIKAGEFRIPATASMADVLSELTEGTPIVYAVTIPEGFTTWAVVERVKADPNLTGEITEIPPEGSLLPDTYHYERGDDRQAILDRMRAAQAAALDEVWAKRDPDLPIETPEELVTLASIVEKETGVASERPQVAAVFVNRLENGMRLQSDPTIIYGITRGEGTLGRGLTRSEIEEKTDYNTYQIDGLPPGPIANPGIEALRATANPADIDALYFVAKGADPSEGHVFARTYAEHRQNVAKWRAIERQAAREAEERAAAEAEAAKDALEAEQAGEQSTDETGAN